MIIDNEEYFKTGDLARYNAKGELVHAGRIDFHIKIDDQRVETDEIERTVIACSSNEISNCLVIKLSQDDELLVTYVISDNSQFDIESIRNYCKDHLRQYMVPSYFVLLDKFPLDENGKVDRKKLPLTSLPSDVPMQFVKVDEPVPSIASNIGVCISDKKNSKGNLSNIIRFCLTS